MPPLVSSARSLLHVRVASAFPPCLTVITVPSPRSSSSQAQDEGPWTTLAVYNPVAWQQAVKPAFLTFLKLRKHLMVPVAFKVPNGDESWPEVAWGYPLGKHAAWLRKQWREGGSKIYPIQKTELDEMTFAWEHSQYKWDQFVLPGLRRFYELNGHTDVPADFQVPIGDPKWPDRLWGQRLGRKVLNIRSRGDFARQVCADSQELERLRFCHDSTLYDRDWREKLVPALKVFRQVFDHCNVNSGFTVPSSSPWPKAAWGMSLGSAVNLIRCQQLGVGRDTSEMDELGFVWDHFEWEWSERILPALGVYRQLNGHTHIPRSFLVPSDKQWPKQTWGLRLGETVNRVRSANAYSVQVSRDRFHLEKLGFVWNFYEEEWKLRILPALEAFYRVHEHSRVPTVFIVPSEAAWPEKTHGLKLGFAVANIRSRGSYFDYLVRSIDSLEAINFDVKIPIAKWNECVEPLLTTFEQLHGDCAVPHDFVVPSSAPWEEKDWGIPLGKIGRTQQLSQEAYQPFR